MPSPVFINAFVVVLNTCPAPPVAKITAGARKYNNSPVSMRIATMPAMLPSTALIKSNAYHSLKNVVPARIFC